MTVLKAFITSGRLRVTHATPADSSYASVSKSGIAFPYASTHRCHAWCGRRDGSRTGTAGLRSPLRHKSPPVAASGYGLHRYALCPGAEPPPEPETTEEGNDMADEELSKIIGKPMSKSKVVVERGPVANFATAVCDTNPVYRDLDAARASGLDAIPVPPTFPFVMETWGKFAEIQPADVPSGNPMGEVLGPLMAKGGIILHGEQEFIYHRPVVVGDVLLGEGSVVDAYAKESKGKTMTFIVTETNWREERSGDPVVTTRFNVIHRG